MDETFIITAIHPDDAFYLDGWKWIGEEVLKTPTSAKSLLGDGWICGKLYIKSRGESYYFHGVRITPLRRKEGRTRLPYGRLHKRKLRLKTPERRTLENGEHQKMNRTQKTVER